MKPRRHGRGFDVLDGRSDAPRARRRKETALGAPERETAGALSRSAGTCPAECVSLLI
jgi:hypothetical protein